MEIIQVTGVAGSTFTIVKAQEGTSDNNHNSGDAIELLFTAGTLTELETRINSEYTVVTVTSNYTALTNDYLILCNALYGPITINLPSTGIIAGDSYIVKKIDSSINTVTIDALGSQLIDGQLTQTIGYQNTAVVFTNDGTNWWMS
jgi:hypothetical protein